jgi:peptidoglycan/LPS O-acetylase OafA/YrhL
MAIPNGVPRLHSIQALRGIAAFAVMAFHLTAGDSIFMAKLPALGVLFIHGDLGVWMFFTISGFVIPHAMQAIDYRVDRDGLRFFLRRVVRLEPPYAVSVFIAIAASYAATLSPAYRGAAPHVDLTTFLVQFFYAGPWFDRPWINVVAWTLAIEFQYYILMLFIAPLLLSRSKFSITAFFALAFASAVMITEPRAVFLYLPLFAPGFAAFLLYRRTINSVGFLALLAACCLVNFYQRGLPEMIMTGVSALLILVPLRRPLPILGALGTISYSLYLVHLPIGQRIINLTMRVQDMTVQLLGLALAVAASLGVAWALWFFVERSSSACAKRWFQVGERHSSTISDGILDQASLDPNPIAGV